MKKSILRVSFLFCLLFLICIRIAGITISSTLNSKPSIIKRALQASLGFEVSFDKIDFSLINGIKFKDFSLKDGIDEIIFIRELRIYPSLVHLFKKRIKLNKILAIDCSTSTDIARYKSFFLAKFVDLTRKSNGDINASFFGFEFNSADFYIRNLKVFLGRPIVNSGFLSVNSDISKQRENLTIKTVLDLRKSNFNSGFIKRFFFFDFSHKAKITLQLAFMKEDMLINNLVFSSDNIKISGAGIVYNFQGIPVVDIKLITIPLNLKELVNLKSKIAISGLLNVVANLKGGFNALRLQTEMLMPRGEFYLPNNIIKISNVFCNINFKNNEVIIKEISGLLNYRFPIFISGEIKNFINPEFKLTIESYRANMPQSYRERNVDFLAKINCRFKDGELIGDSDVLVSSTKDLPYYKNKKESIFKLNNLKVSYGKDFSAANSQNKSFDFISDSLSIATKEFVNEEIKNTQNLKLNNLRAKIFLVSDSVINLQLLCSGYDGSIEARGELNTAKAPDNNYLIIKLNDLSITDLKSLYPINSDISGVLKGWLYFKKGSNALLDGSITIGKGEMAKFNLIDDIADFLKIQSIRELKNVGIFAIFSKDNSGINVKRFNLHNDNLNLNAQVNINNQGWIVGQVYLTVDRNILEESPILKTLLAMVKEKGEKIDFNFKISGFSRSLRLELVEGEFRGKLIQGLSGGIRSQIENEIDKAIRQFREKSPE